MCNFGKVASVTKKCPLKNDQHHVPAQRSRAISNLSVVARSHYMRRLQMTVL